MQALRCGLIAVLLLGASSVMIVQSGCQSASIAMKESVFGIAKREQLVARVQDARESQDEAKQQFATALDEFVALTGAPGGELEKRYAKLKKEYDRCETAASSVRGRIGKVETVGSKLFTEWTGEIATMTDPSLKFANQQQMDQTRVRYDQMVAAMKQAEAKMAPVLTAFRDRVTFLKGALNAQAIASLNASVGQMQSDVSRLIGEMNASIAEADEFIGQMKNK
jgi:hypothetical protein